MISIVVVDDQELVRAGLRKIFETEADMVVVGEAADGEAAVEVTVARDPDVALLDIRMPRLDGIEAVREISRRAPRSRTLMLTTFGLDDYVYESLRNGASGFLLKDAPAEDLVAAVRVVAGGDAVLSPAVTAKVVERFVARGRVDDEMRGRVDALSERELEVLRLLTRGLSNAELSRALIVSEATAKSHVARVLQKLGVRDRVQAVIAAYESGAVRPGDPR